MQRDIVKLIHRNVFHYIYVGTRLQGRSFMQRMVAMNTSRKLRKCWAEVFSGAPDYIFTDAGTNFNLLQSNVRAKEMGTIVSIAPTEAQDCIGKIEKSHSYMKKA